MIGRTRRDNSVGLTAGRSGCGCPWQ